MERKSLTKGQKICFMLLWVVLCAMLFTLPSEKSMNEKIFIAIVSGIIIFVGINVTPYKKNRRNRK
jgi:FtsH-binding integral membrane protein